MLTLVAEKIWTPRLMLATRPLVLVVFLITLVPARAQDGQIAAGVYGTMLSVAVSQDLSAVQRATFYGVMFGVMLHSGSLCIDTRDPMTAVDDGSPAFCNADGNVGWGPREKVWIREGIWRHCCCFMAHVAITATNATAEEAILLKTDILAGVIYHEMAHCMGDKWNPGQKPEPGDPLREKNANTQECVFYCMLLDWDPKYAVGNGTNGKRHGPVTPYLFKREMLVAIECADGLPVKTILTNGDD